MNRAELVLYMVKLCLGGFSAFLAILLWSKTRDAAWLSISAGTIINYTGIVYSLLLDFGVMLNVPLRVCGIPVITLFFAVLPPLFVIIALLIVIGRSAP